MSRVHDLELAAQELARIDSDIVQCEAEARQADHYVGAGHAVTHYARRAAAKRAEKDRLEERACKLFAKLNPPLIDGEKQQGVPDRCLGCERYLADGISWGRGQYCEPCFRVGLGIDPKPSPPAGERDVLDLLDRL